MGYKNSKNMSKYREQRNEEFAKRKKINSIKKLIFKRLYSKALNEIEEYLEKYPNDSYGLFQRATVYKNIGDIELAKEEFERIIDLNLESKHSALFKLGIIAFEEGDFDKAAEIFKTNIETSPYDEIYSVLQLSYLELIRCNKEEAERVLKHYGNMDDERILLQYALVLLSEEQHEKAYEIINSHEYSDDYNVISKYYNIKGSIESKLRLYDVAEKSFEKAMEFDNDHVHEDKISIDWAIMYYEKGDYLKAYDKCMDIISNPNSTHKENAYLILGGIEKYKENYKTAEKFFNKALETQMYPNNRGYYFLGELYGLLDQKEKALECYEKVINTSSNKRLINSSYFRSAVLYMKLDDSKKFAEYMTKTTKKELSNTEKASYTFYRNIITRNYDSIKMTHTYLQLQDYSLDRLVNHIDKTHILYNQESRFNEDINLEELVLMSPKLLEEAHLIENSVFDLYHVKYENIGYVCDEKTDCLEIVAFPNSERIITMYPHNKIILEEEKHKVKTKQNSQISKFYAKYGKM